MHPTRWYPVIHYEPNARHFCAICVDVGVGAGLLYKTVLPSIYMISFLCAIPCSQLFLSLDESAGVRSGRFERFLSIGVILDDQCTCRVSTQTLPSLKG